MTCPEIISQLIIKARSRMFSLAGKDFAEIFLPVTSICLEWVIQNSEVMQFALENFTGKISVNCPKHKLLNSSLKLIHKPLRSHAPLDAITFLQTVLGSQKNL